MRIKMSRQNTLFFLVEGRTHDRSFYDRVIRNAPAMKDWRHDIRLVGDEAVGESVSSDAGGKQVAYALFTYYEEEGLLVRKSNAALSGVVFVLDRDFDHLSGMLIESPHILYTRHADVEAEVLGNGSLIEAVGAAYSLDVGTIESILGDLVNPSKCLAAIWKEWLILLHVVQKFQIYCGFHLHQGSTINDSDSAAKYGPVNHSQLESLRARVVAGLEEMGHVDCTAILEASAQEVEELIRAGREIEFLKGKWIQSFLSYWIKKHEKAYNFRGSVQQQTIVSCCMLTLDFDLPWAEHYNDRISRAIKACELQGDSFAETV
ncbi:hypothetical protein [Glycomyces paridis]|uniref:DUF4435 domain-containing protein n=1 Tax=Glycomyces paridis TaxID=2126555 RepID=A0A4S8PJ37_9ACTN|nr:hypothetical protein [Glycomyces paridis]THV29655.1 hypothetical protein E9998_09230 [Glycomyces paridis]